MVTPVLFCFLVRIVTWVVVLALLGSLALWSELRVDWLFEDSLGAKQ